jgi:hypothetical protein
MSVNLYQNTRQHIPEDNSFEIIHKNVRIAVMVENAF